MNIKDVKVPKNMKHLLHPLDLTTSGVVKKMAQREFSVYFTNCITEALLADPKRDVTTIKVNLKLSTLKPIHAKIVSKVYENLKSDRGKQVILNGFRAAGISEAAKKIWKNPKSGLNPYWIDNWVNFVVLKKVVVLETKLLLGYKLIFLGFSPY